MLLALQDGAIVADGVAGADVQGGGASPQRVSSLGVKWMKVIASPRWTQASKLSMR
ncbi:hypothetical protein KRR26_14100 [Corallococcus sp. M34]|uniref:hypothetical protein n=1 Tax=Citreicoccus inhibens TaxID=2849499 RepID=UPI001315553D|nr:hypothetical protein [Citreicoccus inhibens]MBU8896746.1 hypothetical protein [Citreicoccus inhibens]